MEGRGRKSERGKIVKKIKPASDNKTARENLKLARREGWG